MAGEVTVTVTPRRRRGAGARRVAGVTGGPSGSATEPREGEPQPAKISTAAGTIVGGGRPARANKPRPTHALTSNGAGCSAFAGVLPRRVGDAGFGDAEILGLALDADEGGLRDAGDASGAAAHEGVEVTHRAASQTHEPAHGATGF